MRRSPHLSDVWKTTTGSDDTSPLISTSSGLVAGRTAETAVSITSPEWVRSGARIVGSTYMTKLSLVVDHDTVYGMSKGSLEVLSCHQAYI